MRIVVAALLGGLVVFVWGFLTHMVLPISTLGHQMPESEDIVLAGLRDGLPPVAGVYYIPGLAPEDYRDADAVAAYSAKARANPNAVIFFQPEGRDGTNMTPQLLVQWISATLAALLVAWVLSVAAVGFGQRVAISTALGLFAWLAISVPYWNWYRFPLEFTIGSLLEHVLGWLLAGLAMAWWLGRSPRRRIFAG